MDRLEDGMDFADKFANKKECIVFEENEVAEIPKRRRKYLSLRQRFIVWGILLTVAFSVWAVASRDVFGKIGDLGKGGGEKPQGIVGQGGEEETEDGTQRESDTSFEQSEETKNDDGEDSETEGVYDDNVGKTVTADLSLAEKGDAYIIDYSGSTPDAEGLLEMGFSGARYSYSQQPVVLILHTHTKETYFDYDPNSVTDSMTKSVVSVGEKISYELNSKGIPTVHCTVIHSGNESGAYAEAASTIEDMLKIYPSIEYVIDLHRLDEKDADGLTVRTKSAIGSGQVRMTVSSGGVYEKDTLALALSVRRELNKDGKRLCLPVVYTDSRFNSDLVPYYIKLDVGAKGNTTEEALAAGEYFAEVFADLLKK